MWVWDERSMQAVSPLTSRDRRKYHAISSHIRVAAATFGGAIPVLKRYKSLCATCFRNPVSMNGRVGLTLVVTPEGVDRQLAFIEPLGKIPLILRFYRHEGPKGWKFTAGVLRSLHEKGHAVSAALVQDRLAVKDPAVWTEFAGEVLGQVHDCVDMVEAGHAINRSKWGIWNLEEYSKLLEAISVLQSRYPEVKLIGPAAIDFEFPFVLGALKSVPSGLRFSALSHHLYVDRRGAPENRQGPFSAVEKFALGRAIAETQPQCGGKFIVSEVNWPIAGTGVYSPVGSPYVSPGPRFNDPSVSEESYADYLVRYLVLACCSGMVERVYWWNLVARGFGLVDDTNAGVWRERLAYHALKFFLWCVGRGTFTGKVSCAGGGDVFMFDGPEGKKIALAYSRSGAHRARLLFSYSKAVDLAGNPIGDHGVDVPLSGSPIYLLDVS